jgi:hypothetical protein
MSQIDSRNHHLRAAKIGLLDHAFLQELATCRGYQYAIQIPFMSHCSGTFWSLSLKNHTTVLRSSKSDSSVLDVLKK